MGDADSSAAVEEWLRPVAGIANAEEAAELRTLRTFGLGAVRALRFLRGEGAEAGARLARHAAWRGEYGVDALVAPVLSHPLQYGASLLPPGLDVAQLDAATAPDGDMVMLELTGRMDLSGVDLQDPEVLRSLVRPAS